VQYKLKPSKTFLKQLKELGSKSNILVSKKINLARTNPRRNKRIEGFKFNLFRIRFKDKRKEKRLIYVIEKDALELLFISDRKKEYKDLKKYLEFTDKN